MKFAFIQAEKASFPVAVLCRVLQVSRQGFYASQSRPEPARQVADRPLSVEIAAIHTASVGATAARGSTPSCAPEGSAPAANAWRA